MNQNRNLSSDCKRLFSSCSFGVWVASVFHRQPHAAPTLNHFKAQIGTKLNLHLRRTQSPARGTRTCTSLGDQNLRSRRTRFKSLKAKIYTHVARQSTARRRPLRLRFNETCRGAFGLISKYLFLNLGCGIGVFRLNFRLKFICFFILTM